MVLKQTALTTFSMPDSGYKFNVMIAFTNERVRVFRAKLPAAGG